MYMHTYLYNTNNAVSAGHGPPHGCSQALQHPLHPRTLICTGKSAAPPTLTSFHGSAMPLPLLSLCTSNLCRLNNSSDSRVDQVPRMDSIPNYS